MPLLRLPLAFLLALAVLLSACDSDDDDDDNTPPAGPDIVELAQANDDLETLVTALGAADLVTTLQGAGPFTVFAPTDDAFDALPEGELARLLEPANQDELEGILLYHVLSSEARAAALSDGLLLTTIQGSRFAIVASSSAASGFGIDTDDDGVANANIVQTDVDAENGVVHVIDSVLLPPATAAADIVDLAIANSDLSTLVTALGAADLVETLRGTGPFTVFAPTNAAFEALPEGELDRLLDEDNKGDLTTVLLYHVLMANAASTALEDGASLMTVNELSWTVVATTDSPSGFGIDTDGDGDADANIVQTDIDATNGIVHVIDRVLLPTETQTITAVASANASFSELVGALVAADLAETLAGEGPFTVFAPVNDAFGDLDEVPTGDALANVLLYHVLGSEAFSTALEAGLTLTTLSNEATFTIVASGDAVSGFGIDTDDDGNADANIQAVDVDTANGVIHVIDAVLIP